MKTKTKQGSTMARKAQESSKGGDQAKEICFVIMPFGGWLDDYYETIYCPAIEATGLEPHRADDLFRPSTIVTDIWGYTQRAKLLIADLTGKNPNVFYELGLAHALAKPAILLAESMEEIPFDLRALRVIVYDKNHPKWGELLQRKIQTAIKEILKAPQEAVLPAFLNVKETDRIISVTPHEKELLEIKQELESLRREVRSRAPSGPSSYSMSETKELVDRYLAMGLNDDQIADILMERKAPDSLAGSHSPFVTRRRR
jgi:hypothetical protein